MLEFGNQKTKILAKQTKKKMPTTEVTAVRKLLKEVDEKTKEGNDLLGSLNDKEVIAKFLTEFSNFLDSLRERGVSKIESQ